MNKRKSNFILTFLIFIALSAVVCVISYVSKCNLEIISADKLDCLGSLKYEKTEYAREDKENFPGKNINENFIVSDDIFFDGINNTKVDAPIYKSFKGAFDVKNGKTYAIMSFAANGIYNEKNSVDFSAYRTRKAFRVFDGKRDTGEVIYCCFDDLGKADVFATKFSKSGMAEYAEYLFKISANPAKIQKASSLGLSGKYAVKNVLYECSLNDVPESEKLNYSKLRFEFSGKYFLSSEKKEKIKTPLLEQNNESFELQGSKKYAVMYYVGEKWDSFNSVEVTQFKKTAAYDILDEKREKTGYTVYFLTDEDGEKKVCIARFSTEVGRPKHSEYLLEMKKIAD